MQCWNPTEQDRFLFVDEYGRDACQEYDDSPATTFGCMNCERQEIRTIYLSFVLVKIMIYNALLVLKMLTHHSIDALFCGS